MTARDVEYLEGPASAGMEGKTCLIGFTFEAVANTGFFGGGEYLSSRMTLSDSSASSIGVMAQPASYLL